MSPRDKPLAPALHACVSAPRAAEKQEPSQNCRLLLDKGGLAGFVLRGCRAVGVPGDACETMSRTESVRGSFTLPRPVVSPAFTVLIPQMGVVSFL